MDRSPTRSISVHLDLYTIEAEGLSRMACAACGEPLDLHQPNPGRPDQFLATCPECDRWYRAEAMSDGDRVVVLRIPEPSGVRDAGRRSAPRG